MKDRKKLESYQTPIQLCDLCTFSGSKPGDFSVKLFSNFPEKPDKSVFISQLNLSADSKSLHELCAYLLTKCGLVMQKMENLCDTYSDQMNLDYSRNSIWPKHRKSFTDGINENKIMAKFVTTADGPDHQISIPVIFPKETYKTLQPFAKIPFCRLTVCSKTGQPQDNTIYAYLDMALMPNGKWYLFFQVKGSSPADDSWIENIKSKYCDGKPPSTKVILYLTMLNNMNDAGRDEYLKANSIPIRQNFKNDLEQMFKNLRIEDNNKDIHETSFFDFCGRIIETNNNSEDSFHEFCEEFVLKDCKFRISKDEKFSEPIQWNSLKKYLSDPSHINWGKRAPLPHSSKNKAEDGTFRFSEEFIGKGQELACIGLDLTTPDDVELSFSRKIFPYDLRTGVSILLHNALTERDSCYHIYKLIKNGKIEFETPKYNDMDYSQEVLILQSKRDTII